MKPAASLILTPGVQQELQRLKTEGMLEVLDSEFSPGILRGINGNKNVSLLNATLPRARYIPILASDILTRTLVEFDFKAAELLKTEKYMVKGYAGITSGDGALAYLHAHDGMSGIVNAVIAGDERPTATTMFYIGEESPERFRDRPMLEAIEGLGGDNFVQPGQGRIAQFGAEDFHGEPPLPANIPRMLLVAYSYE